MKRWALAILGLATVIAVVFGAGIAQTLGYDLTETQVSGLTLLGFGGGFLTPIGLLLGLAIEEYSE